MGPRASEGARRPTWVVDGSRAARKRPHAPARGDSQARVKHVSACGGWMDVSLVANGG